MKKYFPVLIFAGVFSMSNAANAQGTMRVDGGTARIVCTGAPSIVLNNMHFANNASSTMFTAANSNFYIQGNLSSNISSTGPFNTSFYNTIINKTGGSEIDVITDNMTLTTTNTLTMTLGNVDMNNNVLSTWALGTSTANLGTLARTSGHFYRGFFQRWYNNGAPGADVAQWDIPVGMNAASYNYARVYYTAGTGGTIRTMFNPVNPFYTGMPMVDNTNFAVCGAPVNINNCANEGYWLMIAQNGMEQIQPYTIKLCYTNFTAPGAEDCLRIIKSENTTSWMQEGTHGLTNPAGDWLTRDGQTGFPYLGATALFTIAGDQAVNPLPVELAAFNANCTSNSIMVSWTTASENGNDYFVLERSKDLVTWDIISVIPTLNGNSNVSQQYSYEDHSYGGTFYYRLNQVDVDGTPTTYPPITLTCNGNVGDPAIVNAYPNGDAQFTLVLYTPVEGDYTLGLYDLHGKKILASTGMLGGGNNTITLDASLLRDAYYLVNVQIGDKNLSRKIFVK
jgi:hypothetical protein